MIYATQIGMTERYGEDELIHLTDRLGAGLLDVDVLDRAMTEADGLVEAALAGRYALPLAPVPALITGAACDLARALLYKDALPDVVERRATDARRLLDHLARGLLTLGAAAPATTGAVGVAYAAPESAMADSPYASE